MRAFRGHITRARMDRLSGICTYPYEVSLDSKFYSDKVDI